MGGAANAPPGQSMRLAVEASLTYDFATPCEVLLLVEAAHGPDQSVGPEALTFWPNVDAVRVDDPVTHERRTVFTASGRINALYRAEVEVMARDQNLIEAPAMAIRDRPLTCCLSCAPAATRRLTASSASPITSSGRWRAGAG